MKNGLREVRQPTDGESARPGGRPMPCAGRISPKSLGSHGLTHHSQSRQTAVDESDEGPPNRYAAEVRLRAVNRINDPLHGSGPGGTEFLAEDGMGRVLGADQLPHHDFSPPIGFGHGIEFLTRVRFGIDHQWASEPRQRLPISEVRQTMEKFRIR